MSEDAVVCQVLDRLESLGLEYMLVGSYASNAYGRPRSSFDADVVARIPPEVADAFVQAFEAEFAIEPESLRNSIRDGRMFNLIPRSGIFKVDIIPIRQTPYAQVEFARRRAMNALGRRVWMAAPEDVILSKLEWFRRGGGASGRQIEDARDVYALQRGTLDDAHLDRWAQELGVRDLLDRIRAEAGAG